MGKVTEQIEAYRGGHITLDELAEFIADYPFKLTQRQIDREELGPEHDPEPWGDPLEDDTWEEVDKAYVVTEILTYGEFAALHEARFGKPR